MYTHLSRAERQQIEALTRNGCGVREVARQLGRSASTVSRELRRNCGSQPWTTPFRRFTWITPTPRYSAAWATWFAAQRSARSRRHHRLDNRCLATHVIEQLRQGWTPQMIAGRLAKKCSSETTGRISHECIYTWIYSPTLERERLWEYLPQHHRRRGRWTSRHSYSNRQRSGGYCGHTERIRLRTSISDQSEVANLRTEFGHWEADTVEGLRSVGDGFHTEVERVSRFLIVRHIAAIDSHSTISAQLNIFAALRECMRRSVTMDNGRENARHYELRDVLRMQTYFADPYCAWQRGTNEHFNGRLRRYFPKGTNLAAVSDEELQDIVAEINNQPRRVLNWRTAKEVFEEQLAQVLHLQLEPGLGISSFPP